MSRIYMDYNATTPLAKEVVEAMQESISTFGNPASAHQEGQAAEAILSESREIIARSLSCFPEEVVFTSGGTESNMMVLNLLDQNEGFLPSKFITTPIEHSSIMEGVTELIKRDIEVQFVRVDSLGNIDYDHLRSLVDSESLVSIILANNEVGTVQDGTEIANIVKEKGGLLHFDATQYFGKFPLSLATIKADYVTVAAHKIYGPRGIGALFVRKGAPFMPLFVGGGQEDERRAGTANQWLASGFATAVTLRESAMEREEQRLREYKEYLVTQLSAIDGVSFNGRVDLLSIAGTLNFTVSDIENEMLLLYLDMGGIAVSTGSACASRSFKPSHVLTALGRAEHEAYRTIRISMGYHTTKEEVQTVALEIEKIILKIRKRRSSVSLPTA